MEKSFYSWTEQPYYLLALPRAIIQLLTKSNSLIKLTKAKPKNGSVRFVLIQAWKIASEIVAWNDQSNDLPMFIYENKNRQ